MMSYLVTAHALQRELAYLPGFSVFVWKAEYDLKTLRVDAYFFENGENNIRFQKYSDTCRQGLKSAEMKKSKNDIFHLPSTSPFDNAYNVKMERTNRHNTR